MRIKPLVLILLIALVTPPYLFSFQLTSEEIKQREEMEEFLRTAKIVKVERIGEGVTKPKRLYLKKDNMEASGCWKNPSGVQGGVLEGWDYEIAAYCLDKLLDLCMVPPTVQRNFRLQRGSFQLWMTLETSELERRKENIPIPPEKEDHVAKVRHIQRVWDSLIANIDRSQQNIRYTKDWRLILIDHSRSFRTKDTYTKRLLYGKNGLKGSFPFEKLPRKFVDKIRALTARTIRMAAGNYLTDREIECLLYRRDLIIKEIDELIAERGEDQVLY
ncbi:MAG: hypothetical protein PVI11_02470 [Candidatus Aminicenantes bacterium]|jgi:hypothetical protein